MEIEGVIIKKLDVVTGKSARGDWKKQEFIIESGDKYPKQVCIEAWSDDVDKLDKFKPNDKVKLSINAESREYNGRWYTSLRFWKIEAAGAAGNSNPSATNSGNAEAPVMDDFASSDNAMESDDLPF